MNSGRNLSKVAKGNSGKCQKFFVYIFSQHETRKKKEEKKKNIETKGESVFAQLSIINERSDWKSYQSTSFKSYGREEGGT